MMIPEDIIVRIRESVDLVELIRESVTGLKKAGRNYQARCPFHQERSPSFVVNPALSIFKCFGCGVGGDAFKFVMLLEHLSYPEAIRKLAARVQIEIPEETQAVDSPDALERERFYKLMEDAASFYERYLWQSKEAEQAKQYLLNRGLTESTLKKFRVGYAPSAGSVLVKAATQKGWSLTELEQVGLLRYREGSTARASDYFWNRILFPIWDIQGRLIAFGGRVMGDGVPKYLNSPETKIYSKGRHLYGLHQGLSTVRKKQSVKILEGYVDVIACHQAGIEDTVATLGTAVTDDHVRLLKRYVEKVQLIFDPDAAGAQAARRGGELLLAQGFEVTVVQLPNEQDADEVLKEQGVEALAKALENEEPYLRYCIRQALDKAGTLTPQAKGAISEDLLPLVAKVQDPLLQDAYLQQVADALHTDKSVLMQTLQHRGKRKMGNAAPAEERVSTTINRPGRLTTEEEIILLVLRYPTVPWKELLETITWSDERCLRVWNLMSECEAVQEWPVKDWLTHFSGPDQDWLIQLSLEERFYKKPDSALQDWVAAWSRDQDQKRFKVLQKQVARMMEGQEPSLPAVIDEYHTLAKQLKGSVSSSPGGQGT